jgi:hypothetical protein
MNAWQVGFIEPDVLIVLERIGQDTAMFDLGEQTLHINRLKGRTTRSQEVDSGSKQVAGAEDIALLDMIASHGQFHQSMEKFRGLSRFKRDERFYVVMTLQKFTRVEELNPSL